MPDGKKRRIFAACLVPLPVGRIEGKPSLNTDSVKAGRGSKRETSGDRGRVSPFTRPTRTSDEKTGRNDHTTWFMPD